MDTRADERVLAITYEVTACPVCSSESAEIVGHQQHNRYLEEFSILLGVDENVLAQAFAQMRCTVCGLIFKSRWFSPGVYERVFVDSVPVHPRGWDSVLDKFTPCRFTEEVQGLASALRDGAAREINKRRRTVQSYLDNIPRTALRSEGVRRAVQAARRIDLNALSAEDERLLTLDVAPLLAHPKSFGRFSGYGNLHVQSFLRAHLPEVRSYAEVGCPLWGLIPYFSSQPGVAVVFLQDEEKVFWGEKCVGEESAQNCASFAQERFQTKVSSLRVERHRRGQFDLMAVIHYLDHLARPLEFLKVASEISSHLLLMSHRDARNSVGSIQHSTVFGRQVVEYMAGVLQWTILGECPCPEDADDENLIILLKTRGREEAQRSRGRL